VQTLKAGIMEIADLFVINKADLPGADRLQAELEGLLSLAPSKNAPPILRTVGTEGTGIEEWMQALGSRAGRPKNDILYWEQRLYQMIRERLMNRLMHSTLPDGELRRLAAQIAERRENPYEVVETIVGKLAPQGIGA
jgi:LAO/AO transport system kinase